MTPETADRVLDRAAAWLSAHARTPGHLPFRIDVEPDADRVRLQAWSPSPIDQNLAALSDSDSTEIARLLLAPRLPLQIADHGARSLLVGRGRIDVAWLVRRRPHLSLPVVALSPDDRLALSLWLARADLDATPLPLQGGSAHDRLRRHARVPPLDAGLDARVRNRYPRLVLLGGQRVKALVHLPDASPPQILSLA
jgi:hypothetical protein